MSAGIVKHFCNIEKSSFCEYRTDYNKNFTILDNGHLPAERGTPGNCGHPARIRGLVDVVDDIIRT